MPFSPLTKGNFGNHLMCVCSCLFCLIHCLNWLISTRSVKIKWLKGFILFYENNQIGSYLKWCHREKLQRELCCFGCRSYCRRKSSPGESFSQCFYPGPNRLLRSWVWSSSAVHDLRFLMHSPVPLLDISSLSSLCCWHTVSVMPCIGWRVLSIHNSQALVCQEHL